MGVFSNSFILVGLAFLQVYLVSSSTVLSPSANPTAISKPLDEAIKLPVQPTPSPDANVTTTLPPTTTPHSNTTTPPPTTTPTTPTPTNATTTTSTSTTSATTTTPIPTTPSTSTPAPTTKPTAAPTQKPGPDSHFDPPSFIGGMILTMGLMAIAFVSWKFYEARTERNYHTL